MSGPGAVINNAPAAPISNPYASASVKAHVPVALDMENSNYTKWSAFFKSMCGKFGLMEHINGSPARPDDPAWEQADCCVRSWLFGSVGDNVLDLAMKPDQTANDLWVAIKDLFQANKEPAAIFLNHQFNSTVQGDMSISDYCLRMKTLADALRDVGHTVSEPQLVLNLLAGLNKKFSNTADDIANADPLPSFTKARGMLVLKELRLANEDKVANDTALLAGTASSCGTACRAVSTTSGNSGGGGSGSSQSYRGGGKGGKGGKGGGGKGNKGGGGKGHQQAAPPAPPQPAGPWVCFNPWAAGQQEPWRAPGAGLLGPYPQAHTAYAPPQVSQSWDQAGLVAAMNQMQLQGAGPWVLDTGATSHMSSTDGPLDAARDSSLQ
ncbi:hypothetical protein ACP70R_012221 [Stipagrostis hirtigluma subsp. patula]